MKFIGSCLLLNVIKGGKLAIYLCYLLSSLSGGVYYHGVKGTEIKVPVNLASNF
jgi:hypothetical protein